MVRNRHFADRFFWLLLLWWPCAGSTGIACGEEIKNGPTTNETEKVESDAMAPGERGRLTTGRLLRVPLPITGNVARRLIEQIQRASTQLKSEASGGGKHSVLILEFDPGSSEFGLGSEFEDSLKLARFLISPALEGVKTVAYLPRSIRGHALLVVMACDQIVMSPETVIGDAGAGHGLDRPLDNTILNGYRQISQSRHTVPIEISEAMLDKKRKLLQVKTDEGPQLVFANQLPKLRQTRTIDPDHTSVVFPGGQPALLTGRQARSLGLAAHLAPDRQALAQHLGLSRESIRINPLLEGVLRPRMILVDRYIDPRFAETRLAMMDQAIRDDGVNLFCLWIDSNSGDVESVTRFAAYLAELDAETVFTVAYIPESAGGRVSLIALACDDIIMHPNAVIGGAGKSLSPEQLTDITAIITDLIVPHTLRSYALTMAMFKKDLVVYQFQNRRTGLVQYFTEAQFQQLPDQKNWERGKKITNPGELLRLTGMQAEDLGIATAVVNNFSELKKEYGLEADPALVKPNWVDQFVGMLASPGLAWLLLLIGLAGIYAELQMPGIGIGSFIATIAFTLYFWSNFMNHTANELEIILFLVGISCLILEIFIIPGFGIFGLGGGALILISLILASQTFVLPRTDSDLRQLRNSLLVVGGAFAGMVGFALIMHRYLPNTPILARLMLPAQGTHQEKQDRDESLHGYQSLLGQVGRTTTQLTPSGKATFAGKLVDVISDAELIPVDIEVEVIEVRGGHVLVRVVEI